MYIPGTIFGTAPETASSESEQNTVLQTKKKAVEDERSQRSESVTASLPQCHSQALVRMVCRQLLTQLGRALGVNGPEVQSSPLYR
jgi:hypothetical protein